MLRALPVVRDAELLVRKGFEVLPPADPAADAPPQAVRVLKPAARPDDASPAPTTPAPQPTTTPRRS
jgi:hypothetical protein